MKNSILVTAATGTVGTHLTRVLANKSSRVVLGSRNPESTAQSESDITAVHLDLMDRQSVQHAVEGVDRIFLITPLDPKMVEMTRNVVEAAETADVQGVARLSALHADPDSDVTLWRW
ncbi:MAG: NAD(P)H-binding protein, partial [Balneolaceae bacterium]|nr:NAD(P)H-binding protein [Balneolaceae bacterium]